MTRPRQLLDIDLYKRVPDRNPCIEEVDLFNWGEPLLHPRLNDFISYATAKGIFSRLVTNAVLLDSERSISLLAAGLRAIIFSWTTRGQTISGSGAYPTITLWSMLDSLWITPGRQDTQFILGSI